MEEEQCPECSFTQDIRLEKQFEKDGKILIYYRCKSCGYQWDDGEYLVREEDVKKRTN